MSKKSHVTTWELNYNTATLNGFPMNELYFFYFHPHECNNIKLNWHHWSSLIHTTFFRNRKGLLVAGLSLY